MFQHLTIACIAAAGIIYPGCTTAETPPAPPGSYIQEMGGTTKVTFPSIPGVMSGGSIERTTTTKFAPIPNSGPNNTTPPAKPPAGATGTSTSPTGGVIKNSVNQDSTTSPVSTTGVILEGDVYYGTTAQTINGSYWTGYVYMDTDSYMPSNVHAGAY